MRSVAVLWKDCWRRLGWIEVDGESDGSLQGWLPSNLHVPDQRNGRDRNKQSAHSKRAFGSYMRFPA